MASAAILDFLNWKLLTFGTVNRVELPKHAKFEKSKNRHISAAFGAISTKFGMVRQFDPVEILKIQAEIWYVN